MRDVSPLPQREHRVVRGHCNESLQFARLVTAPLEMRGLVHDWLMIPDQQCMAVIM